MMLAASFCIVGIVKQLPAVVLGCAVLFVAFLLYLQFQYDIFVFLNIFLLSVVLYEPSPSDLLFFVLLVFGIIHQAIRFERIKNSSSILLIYLAYFFLCIPGLICSVDGWKSLKFFLVTFYLFLFAVFILLYLNKDNFLLVIRAYVISSLTAAVMGLIGYFGVFSDIFLVYSERAKGLFKDPNVFGPFLVPAAIFLLHDLAERKVWKAGFFAHIGGIIVVTAGIVLSFSRAAWLNLAVAVLLYFLLNFQRLKMLMLSAALLAVLTLSSLLCLKAVNFNVVDTIIERAQVQEYDKDRFAAQMTGLEFANDNLWGCGPGQYETIVLQKTGDDISAHSLYTRVLTENGIVGFILFFTAFIMIAVRLLFIHIRKGKTSVDCSVLISVLAGILVNSLVVDTLHWRHLWLFLGLSLFSIHEYDEKRRYPAQDGG